MDNRKKNRKRIARKKRREALRVSVKRIPVSVYAALLIAIVSIVSFLAMCIISACNKGNAGLVAGFVPILAALFNVIGLVLAYSCFKMEDVRNKVVSIATILNGFMIIMYLLLYILGMV